MSQNAFNLWKDQNVLKEARKDLYMQFVDDILTEIYYQKGQNSELIVCPASSCYLTKHIPKNYTYPYHQPYFDQKECVSHIISELRKLGFFCKSVDNQSAVFISWFPKHLENVENHQSKEQKRKEEKALQRELHRELQRKNRKLIDLDQKKTVSDNQSKQSDLSIIPREYSSETSKRRIREPRYIDISAQHNELDNRIKLTQFLLRGKVK